MSVCTPKIIAVALNPAIDRGIEVSDFAVGSHLVGKGLFRRPAGKAVNVARVLETLDVPSMLIGFIGKNQQRYFENSFKGQNIACQLFAVDGQTRENITIVDPASNTETHIRDRGFAVSPSDIKKLRKKLSLICREDTIAAFSGSLPGGLSNDDFVELVQVCQANGAKICIDSSGSVLRSCKELKPWLVKPNMLELSEMLETNLDRPDQIIASWDRLKEFVSIAIVTIGKDGALLFSDSTKLKGKVAVDSGRVKNTVGCGDALLAGFLAGVTRGKDIKECLGYGLAVATASAVSLTPADVAIEDVNQFLTQTQITPL